MRSQEETARRVEEQHKRVIRQLRAIVDARGKDCRVALSQTGMGRGKNYLQEVLRGKTSPSVMDVLKLLAAVEADSEDLADLTGGKSPDLFLIQLQRDRHQVGRVRDLLAKPAKVSWSRSELRRKVDALEELRFTDRDKAYSCTVEILRQKPPNRFQVEALRVLGIINWSRGRQSAAAYCLRQALRLGRRHQRAARVLLSVSVLALDKGQHRVAHRSTHRASAIYRERLDLPGVGKTLVQGGRIYVDQGNLRAARASYIGALQLLDPADWLWHFSALQGLGIAEIYGGELPAAKGHLTAALEMIQDREAPTLEGWALWLSGEILLKQGNLTEAGYVFGKLQVRYLESDPCQALHISLRVCKVLYRAGNAGELVTFASGMAALLAPLEHDSPVLAAALLELISAAQEGRLSEACLDACYGAVSKARGASAETPLDQALVAWRQL